MTKPELPEIQCPWPRDIWTMTDEEYVAAVPDENLRTRISGYLARFGWECCVRDMQKAMEDNDD